MALFKAIIVDEDALFAERLGSMADWQENGFLLAGSFPDAATALEYLRGTPVELVIADDTITDADGAPLAERVRQMPRPPHILLLTQIPDFSRAQKAMNMGVSGILAKQKLDREEINRVVEKLGTQIMAERSKSAILKRQVLRDLIHGRKLQTPEVLSRLEIAPGTSTFACLLLRLDRPIPLFPENEEVPHYHVNWHGTVLPSCFEYIATAVTEPYTWLMLLHVTEFLSERTFYEKLYAAAHAAQRNFQEQFSRTVSVALSPQVTDLSTLAETSKELATRVRLSIFYRPAYISTDWQPYTPKADYEAVIEQGVIEIGTCMDAEKIDGMGISISTLFSSFLQGQYNIEGVGILCERLVDLLNGYMMQHGFPSLEERVGSGRLNAPQCYTLEDVYQWFSRAFRQAVLEVNAPTDGEHSSKIKRIIRFVNLNCCENLTISDVAERFNISNDYLRHIFKKETGKSLQTFITLTKIEYAKQLLKDGRYKVFEVAELVGYSSAQYFSSTFKKVTGQSPSDYLASIQ